MSDEHDGEWNRKGAVLSDKTARKEYGLTQNEIYEAVDAGKLEYRAGVIHGNPYLRLLRREVEALVESRHGRGGLRDRRRQAEVSRIDTELCQLRRRTAELEQRKAALLGTIS